MKSHLTFLLFLVGSFLLVAGHTSLQALRAADAERPLVLSTVHPFPGEINEIALDGDYVWLATMDGAVRWHKQDSTQRRFTTRDGLAGNWVLTILIEANGVKWFGTDNGLSRFDGVHWTRYTTAHGLPSNHVTVVKRHPDGRLLVGTSHGLVRFDGVTFSRLLGDGADDDSPGTRQTSAIIVQNDIIWIGTTIAGTYRYRVSNDRWLKHYGDPSSGPGGRVSEMTVAPDGAIWFAFNGDFQDGSVGRMKGDSWTRYRETDGLISPNALTVVADPAGQVYVGFSDLGGVGRFSNGAWTRIFLDEHAGIPRGTPVKSLRIDAGGTLWAAVFDMLLSYDGSNWRIHLMGPPRGANTPGGADNEGNMWLGVPSLGAVRYDGQQWRLYTGRDGMSSGYVRAFASDARGDVWFATFNGSVGAGVRRFDGASWYHYSYDSGLGSQVVLGIDADDAGNVWFATGNGLARFNGSSWKRYTTDDGLQYNHVSDVAVHGDHLWISYYGPYGLSHFDGVSWQTFWQEDGLPDSFIKSVELDSAGLPWVVTDGHLSHFDSVSWTNYPVPGVGNGGYVSSLYVDADDNVWLSIYMGTWSGLTHFRDGVWTTFTTADGLPTDQVYDVTPGAQPYQFWITAADLNGVAEVRLLYGLDQKAYLPLSVSK